MERDRPHSAPDAYALGFKNHLRETKMLALVLFSASLPSIFCIGCATFLAYNDRRQWVWFAGLSVLAGMGAIAVLQMVQLWRFAGH